MNKTPTVLIVAATIGLNSVLLSIFVERLAQSFFPLALHVSLWAIAEELIKLGAVFLVVAMFSLPKMKWGKIGIAVATGFALTEDVFFLVDVPGTDIFQRLFLALPLHVFATMLAIDGFRKSWKKGILSTVYAFILHIAFNVLVMANDLSVTIFALLAFIFGFFIVSIIRKVLTLRTHHRKSNRASVSADI